METVKNKCLDCPMPATHNFKNEKEKIYCKTHAKKYMINMYKKSKLCKYMDCITTAHYNYPEEKNTIYCNIHKLEGMIESYRNVKKCLYPNCYAPATFKSKSNKIKSCWLHKDYKFSNPKCIFNKCKNDAIYNFINENNPKYCIIHKTDEMKNVTFYKKTCIYYNCSNLLLLEGNNRTSLYCDEHITLKNKCKNNLTKQLVDDQLIIPDDIILNFPLDIPLEQHIYDNKFIN
jgi:hypothetical protein